MCRKLFWLGDEQWGRIKPHLPTDLRGVARVNDRRVLSGSVHVLKSDCIGRPGCRMAISSSCARAREQRIVERRFCWHSL